MRRRSPRLAARNPRGAAFDADAPEDAAGPSSAGAAAEPPATAAAATAVRATIEMHLLTRILVKRRAPAARWQ